MTIPGHQCVGNTIVLRDCPQVKQPEAPQGIQKYDDSKKQKTEKQENKNLRFAIMTVGEAMDKSKPDFDIFYLTGVVL